MSIGTNEVKNKVLQQNRYYYYYSFQAVPLIYRS